jgi:Ca-activated chloride channel family protein
VQPGEKLTPPKEKLVAIYPSGGSMWSDNPAVILGAPWATPAKHAAGQAFLKFLKTRPAQELLPKYGFRPLDTSVDVSQYLNAEVGIDPAKPTITLPEPSADVVSAAIDQWADIRKPSAILELIDISGSMDEAAGDGRSQVGRRDRRRPVDAGQLPPHRRDRAVGLHDGYKSDHGANVVPVREFAPLGGDRETIKSSVADLRYTSRGGTPLYDAVATAYDYMVQHAETGRINAIVVLSDGQDTDSDLSLDSLLIKIGSSAKEGTAASPVRIFTIAYGESADTESLGRISKASGGQLFDASDPTKVGAVFASVINNF